MIEIKTRLYKRERYASILEIRPDRVDVHGQLKDSERIAGVMTRWLARCVRDQAVVTGMGHVTAHEEFTTGRWAVRAWAYAFQGVRPEDEDALRSYVDDLRAYAVEILE